MAVRSRSLATSHERTSWGWVDTAEQTYGRLDCAVNNAGIPNSTVGAANLALADWPEEAFDRMIEVNLKRYGVHERRDHCHAASRRRGCGRQHLVHRRALGTAQVRRVRRRQAWVIGLTRVGAIDYGTRGIRVNAICPGFTDTDILRPHMEERGDEIRRQIPAGRVASVEDIAEMAVWLCSDRSTYVTGQAIAVDGGFVAQ